MSLYGPRIKLPKLELPQMSAPSFDSGKTKKILLFGGAAIIIILVILFAAPPTITLFNSFFTPQPQNPVKVSWNNNPWNIRENPSSSAELSITFTNNTAQDKNVYFSLNYPANELIEFCPEYKLNALSPGDKRSITCLFRRSGEIYSGTYTIEVLSNFGNTKTKLEIIAK